MRWYACWVLAQALPLTKPVPSSVFLCSPGNSWEHASYPGELWRSSRAEACSIGLGMQSDTVGGRLWGGCTDYNRPASQPPRVTGHSQSADTSMLISSSFRLVTSSANDTRRRAWETGAFASGKHSMRTRPAGAPDDGIEIRRWVSRTIAMARPTPESSRGMTPLRRAGWGNKS